GFVMPLRQHAIGVVENLARLVDEDFQQIRIDLATSGQREGMLRRFLRHVLNGGSLFGCSVLCCGLLCCGLLCCGLLCCGLLCCGVLCCGALCCGLLRRHLLSGGALGGGVLAGAIDWLERIQRCGHLGSDVSMTVVDRSDRRVGLLVLVRVC